MANIKEVAHHAGLSVASVSRVMAGHAGVSEATRQRVLAAVKALDYRPDLAARRLRSRRTDTIGLIVSDIRNPFFTEVSRAVEDVAYRCERDTAADAVVLDNVDAAYRLTAHLIENGYRRIGCLYGAVSATGHQRQEGYAAAMAAHGLKPQAVAALATVDQARTAAGNLLQQEPCPDALLASSGLILLGATEALRAAQLRFPDDVALAGFDDLPWTRLVEPAITVIAQPTDDLGRAAIDLLQQRIAQPEQAVRRVVLRGELQVRGSSARRSPVRSSGLLTAA